MYSSSRLPATVRRGWRVTAITLLVLAAAPAQQPAPRYYFGEQFTTLRTFQPHLGTGRTLAQFLGGGCFCYYPGFGVRFGFNSNPVVALEAELDYSPRQGSQAPFAGGLEITELSVGLRPGWRWRRLGVFYKIAPGLIDFGNDFGDVFPHGQPPVQFETHDRLAFMLENAGVIEYYLSSRFALRLDLADTFVSLSENYYPGVSPYDLLAPSVSSYHNFQASFGFIVRVWR